MLPVCVHVCTSVYVCVFERKMCCWHSGPPGALRCKSPGLLVQRRAALHITQRRRERSNLRACPTYQRSEHLLGGGLPSAVHSCQREERRPAGSCDCSHPRSHRITALKHGWLAERLPKPHTPAVSSFIYQAKEVTIIPLGVSHHQVLIRQSLAVWFQSTWLWTADAPLHFGLRIVQ